MDRSCERMGSGSMFRRSFGGASQARPSSFRADLAGLSRTCVGLRLRAAVTGIRRPWTCGSVRRPSPSGCALPRRPAVASASASVSGRPGRRYGSHSQARPASRFASSAGASARAAGRSTGTKIGLRLASDSHVPDAFTQSTSLACQAQHSGDRPVASQSPGACRRIGLGADAKQHDAQQIRHGQRCSVRRRVG